MIAQEMFEHLGFGEPLETDYYIHYFHMVEDCDVVFYKKDKTFCAYDSYDDAINIPTNLFKAIQKQLEELGWI